jgi:hypothetical protein
MFDVRMRQGTMRKPGYSLIRFWLTGLLLLMLSTASAESMNGFRLDNASIPVNDIKKGGPPRDGIPSLDDPVFVAADDAAYLKGRDRVLGVSINGVARAYPIRILNYHEIVNDVVGGTAVVITYCPLCGSGTAFEATVDDRKYEFGVSGLLYNSDVLMYDRNTNSLWSQLMVQSVTGPMQGTRLKQLPLSHTSWREWVERHPETQVLSSKTGYSRNYRVDPYPNYGRDGKLYFPVTQSNNKYRRKEIVMGLEIDGRFKAYPFKELKKGAHSFDDEFVGKKFIVKFDANNQTARVLKADGSEIPTTMAFWFAWYAFHPATDVYEAQ